MSHGIRYPEWILAVFALPCKCEYFAESSVGDEVFAGRSNVVVFAFAIKTRFIEVLTHQFSAILEDQRLISSTVDACIIDLSFVYWVGNLLLLVGLLSGGLLGCWLAGLYLLPFLLSLIPDLQRRFRRY